MKILVSTKEKQGQRKNDFCWVPEGEIVHFGFECSGETVDGGCGCRRSMVGLVNSKATTTVKVVQSKISKEDFLDALKLSYMKFWKMDNNMAAAAVNDELFDLLSASSKFKVGTVLERRGDIFIRR